MTSKPDLIRQMQDSTEVVHTIGSKQAEALRDDGMVRFVKIQPDPGPRRQAVSLTARGKGYTGGRVTPPPAPDLSVDSEPQGE